MMWDFTHSSDLRRSRSRSPQPSPFASSPQAPSFPIPHTNGPSPSPYAYGGQISSSYPPAMPNYPPFSPHDVYSIPSPHALQHSPTVPGSYPQPHVIHVIHHSVHHKRKDSKDSKKKSKATPSSLETKTHYPNPGSHKLSHSYSTSQINLPLSTPRPIPFPKAPSHPGSHRHQKTPSQPNTPAQVHYPELPAVPYEHKQTASNVLQKRRPTISLSSTQQIIHPELTPLSPVPLHLPAPQKPLHGILKNKNSNQHLNPAFQYSNCTGRKKAVCIGINYTYQPNVLRGCVNDARRVRDFLIKHGGYRPSDICLLSDEPPKGMRDGQGWDTRLLPTRENIIRAMKWLVLDARQNDSLFFHYSGHGGQTKDMNGDEIDGLDEVIYPVDFRTAGFIVDDELHDILVRPLPVGCRLTGLFDACHSGTILDLPYIYSSHGRLKGSHISNKARHDKATSADVISWTSCLDDQTSSDTFAGGVAVGAMSFAFVTSLTQNPQQTYQQLLRSLRLILHPRYTQKPQLGSSHHIDTNLQFVF